MRILGLETSSRRGSAALLEKGVLVAAQDYDQANAHAERLLPLVAELFGAAGWHRGTLDRIAVGVGPGSFTGVRVGIALAQGIALGLSRPVIGVCSLAAMARAVPSAEVGVRCPVLDARRGEVFTAAYASTGEELLSPRTLAHNRALVELQRLLGDTALLLVGEAVPLITSSAASVCGKAIDLPHASATALLAEYIDPPLAPPEPIYVRGAGASLPNLPSSPFERGEDRALSRKD